MPETPFPGRVLVGLNGQEPNLHLIRYASMVTRLGGGHVQRARALVGGSADLPTPLEKDVSLDGVREAEICSTSRDDAEVRFVYLQPGRRGGRRSVPRRHATPSRAELRAQVKKYFTAQQEWLAVGCDVLKGRAVERLPDVAADFESDLLLLEDAGPGRKSARLAVQAPCCVWLVPPGWAPILRRILVPIDFSPRSAASLQMAVNLARRFHPAKCLALHVYHHETRFRSDEGDRRRRAELAEKFAAFVAEIHTHGVAIAPLLIENHNVSRAIEIASDRHSADLIVMATRGRSRLSGWMLDSGTEAAIRQCRAAFLVLKTADGPPGFWAALRERLARSNPPQFS